MGLLVTLSPTTITAINNLTTNGFVKTTGGNGTLTVVNANYQPLNSNLTNIVAGCLIYTNQSSTSDATPLALTTIPIPSGQTTLIEAFVCASNTGPKGAGYIIRGTYTNQSGTATLVGAVQQNYVAETDAPWDCTLVISGSNVNVQVTGAAGVFLGWQSFAQSITVGSGS